MAECRAILIQGSYLYFLARGSVSKVSSMAWA